MFLFTIFVCNSFAQADTVRLQLPEFTKYVLLKGDTARSTDCFDKNGKEIRIDTNQTNIDRVKKCECYLVLRKERKLYNVDHYSITIEEEKIKLLSTYERINKTTWKVTDYAKDSSTVSKRKKFPVLFSVRIL